jgi:hypothetical protein
MLNHLLNQLLIRAFLHRHNHKKSLQLSAVSQLFTQLKAES